MKEVYIVGIGATRIGEHWDKSLRTLFTEAALMALDDAGMDARDVGALFIGNMSSGDLQGQEHLGSLMATWLGIPGVPAFKIEAACASGGAAVHQAFLAVASGMYDCVIAGGVEKMTDAVTRDVTAALIKADDQEYTAFTGATFVGLNAMVYNYYLRKYGAKREDIALFPVHAHKYAVNAPHAQYRRPVSLESVLKSPVIAYPITLLESSPTGDGAAALVLCNGEKARTLGKDVLVRVEASSVATDTISLVDREDLTTLSATVKAAEKAYRMAGVGPEDIDVVEVHDAFSILFAINLEDLGFAKKGEGWRMAAEGEIEKDGRIPSNLMGGLKARGHPVGATGVYQIYDLMLQFLGRAGDNQVDDVEFALAQNVGGVGGTVTVHILRRVR